MTEPAVRGRIPTPEEKRLLEWANMLSPHDVAQRTHDYVKTLLSTVMLVGTVLTGLGVITGAALVQQHAVRIVVAVSVTCAVSSALLALAALASGSRVVNPANLGEVKVWIDNYVIRKARTARTAGGLLALALLLAIAAALTVLVSPTNPDLVPSTAVISGSGHSKLLVQLSGSDLTPASVVSTKVVATYRDGRRQLVGYQVAAVKRDGTIELNLDIAEVRSDVRLVSVAVDSVQRRCQVQVDLVANRLNRLDEFQCKT